MPDVLIRDITESEKNFISTYARRRGLSQAEVVRQIVRIGVEQLRGSETADDAEWDRLAEALAALGDEGFEAKAWG